MYIHVCCVLPRNFIGGDKCPMCSKYCGTVTIKQGTNDENIKKRKQISWDNVPLNSNWDIWQGTKIPQDKCNIEIFLSPVWKFMCQMAQRLGRTLCLGCSMFESAQEILVLIWLASTQGSDKPVLLHSLARTWAACIYKVWLLLIAQTKIKTCSPGDKNYTRPLVITSEL